MGLLGPLRAPLAWLLRSAWHLPKRDEQELRATHSLEGLPVRAWQVLSKPHPRWVAVPPERCLRAASRRRLRFARFGRGGRRPRRRPTARPQPQARPRAEVYVAALR